MRSTPPARALTLIEVLAAAMVLALVAVGIAPVLRRPGIVPGSGTYEAWVRAYAQDPTGTPQRRDDGARLVRTLVTAATGPTLPGTAPAWELVEAVDADGRVRAWRILPQQGTP